MKVLWLIPPIEGNPNIGQYRFYKNTPVRASLEYPYLNAMGVTQLDLAGFDVAFLDCPANKIKVLPMHACMHADLVVMEARTPILNQVFEVADFLRSEGLTVALFGDHVTWQPNEALLHADYVVLGGDFDYGVSKLAEAIRNNEVVNRKFDVGLVENLDDLPHVNHELVPWHQYYEAWRNRDKFFYTMSGRGCCYNCTFCCWIKLLWHNKLRQRSVKDVVSEFEEVYSKYGVCEIWDDHDCFNTVWGVKFAEKLIKKDFIHKEILWAFQTHSNMIRDLKSLKTMKKSGLHVVKLGIESANQKTLNRIGKHVTVKQHEKAIRLLKEADIMVHANLMVGWPWETKEEAYRTLEWIIKQDPNQAQFSLIIPYPFTPLYDEAKANNWLIINEKDWSQFDASKPMLTMQNMTVSEIVQLYKDSWSRFYLNRKYVWKHLKTVKNWQDIKQLWRGFKSIYFGHMKAIKT